MTTQNSKFCCLLAFFYSLQKLFFCRGYLSGHKSFFFLSLTYKNDKSSLIRTAYHSYLENISRKTDIVEGRIKNIKKNKA